MGGSSLIMDNLSRTLMTVSCRDCDLIPKVASAGRIMHENGQLVQVMHNGLKVVAGGYHGDWMSHIIRALRGHHEPQEEVVFHTLLKYARHGSMIVELGCFWSYYSLWYLFEIPGSRAFCVEPDPHNIGVGQKNALLNGMEDRIMFVEAWVGSSASKTITHTTESTQEVRMLPCLDMAAILDRIGGQTIELLHMDAQGAEDDFIPSMRHAVQSRAVRFLVISTHHRSISGRLDTHGECCDMIRSFGGHILVEHDVQESFSGDGLIVASFFSQDRYLPMPPITRNIAKNALFPEH
jgi:FkbM family methyltransferase